MIRLPEAGRALSEGQSVTQVCRALGVSEQTYLRWRKQYAGMAKPEVNRADQALDISMLKDLAKGNF